MVMTDDIEHHNIEHWKCSECDKVLTRFDGDDIVHDIHFDILRSKKDLYEEDGCVEEACRNVKMEITLCESCFLKVLQESNTLGKHLWNQDRRVYQY